VLGVNHKRICTQREEVLQIRTSALFWANIEFSEIYGVSARTKGLSQCGHFTEKVKGRFFAILCGCPLTNTKPCKMLLIYMEISKRKFNKELESSNYHDVWTYWRVYSLWGKNCSERKSVIYWPSPYSEKSTLPQPLFVRADIPFSKNLKFFLQKFGRSHLNNPTRCNG